MTKSNKQKQSSNLPIEAIDAIIKSGKDPLELMNEMKRAIMERALSSEMDYHSGNEKNGDIVDGNYRNGYGSKTVNTQILVLFILLRLVIVMVVLILNS